MNKKIFLTMAAVALTAMTQQLSAQWSLTGNAGTNPATNFIGTTDNKDLKIRTNNVVRVTVKTTGRVGIGNAAPTAKLDVFGATGAADTIPVINALVKKTGNFDIVAVQAASQPAVGYGIGLSGLGNYIGGIGSGGSFGLIGMSPNVGVDGEASQVGTTIDLTGVQGLTSGGDLSIGVYGEATGANINYGVYGRAVDTAGTSPDYAVVCVGDLFFWRAFAPSDAKLKSNIQPYTGALDKISQLKASTYVFNKAKYPGMDLPSGNQTGFIADEIQQVFPELIKESSIPTGVSRDARGKVNYKSIDDVKAVNYVGLIPVLAEAIKEQKQIVDQKEVVISQQNERITKLEKELAEIKSMLQNNNSKMIGTESGYLLQNTPNPSNGTTQIQFYLPQNSTGFVQVIDVTGKVIKSLKVAGSGMNQIDINTNQIANGSYTYQLVIDNKVVDSKSMVVTK